jgi:acyl-CoA oxidase
MTATKYWPGQLGRWANFATVFAKLMIDGKSKGVQIFMV